MVGSRSTSHDRTLTESEQRELFQQHQHHIRRFEILKSTPLGLVFPQNLQLELKDVDAGLSLTGHSSYLSSGSSPAYVTSEMQWWKEKCMLPPTFEIFPFDPKSNPNAGSPASEISGLPPSPSHDSYHQDAQNSNPWPMAKIKYPGWQGLTQMTIDMTVYEVSKWMAYDHQLHAPSDIRSRWSIFRVGYRREYVMTNVPSTPEVGVYRWRGNKKILDIPAMDDGFEKCNGNLKLEDEDAKLVAVYKQRRDSDVLGGLTVFTDNLKEGLPIEVVVSSCLAVVLYERIGWQNMFGE